MLLQAPLNGPHQVRNDREPEVLEKGTKILKGDARRQSLTRAK